MMSKGQRAKKNLEARRGALVNENEREKGLLNILSFIFIRN